MNLDNLNLWWAKRQFSTDKRLSTYRKLAVMLRNGVQLTRALEDLQNRASDNGRKPNEGMAVLFDSWRRVVMNGGRLGDAVQGWVPYNEQMIISAGETSGHLSENLESVVKVVQCTRAISSAVKTGLTYPMLLMMAVLAYLYMFGVHVIPQFAKIIDPEKWSAVGRSLYLMSIFVQKYGMLTVVILIGTVIAILYSFPRMTGSIRVRCDVLEPWRTYRMVTGAGFLLALASLVSGGLRIQEAFATLSERASPYVKERLDGFLLGVNSGQTAGEAMIQSGYNFPSKEIVDDIAVYVEHSGDFAASLNLIAREWLEEGVNIITDKMAFFRNIAILMVAAVIMWIISGMGSLQQDIYALTRTTAM